MLTKIIINNINAIGHCEISFIKNKYQYLEEMIFGDTVVSPIGIYGANGSGKSSFLKAISSLIGFLTDSPDRISGFTPNFISLVKKPIKHQKKLDDNTTSPIISSIELHFRLNEDEYKYFLETKGIIRISREKLSVNGNVIIDRNLSNYSYLDTKNLINSTSFPVLRSIAKDELTESYVKKAYDFLSNMAFIDARGKFYQHKELKEKRSFDLLQEKSSQVYEILKQYHEMPMYNIVSKEDNSYFFTLEFDNNSVIELPIGLMSNGMFSNSMMLSLLLSLPERGVLFVDEIECALHPLTIMDFINIVKQKNIQLIFSSHNTFLLQQLRPDQIFFANWTNGYSTLKRLSDIYPNIREVNNIEKMYLSNLFEEEIKK